MNILEENVLFIRAGDGFVPESIRREGFRVEKPFYEKGILFRIIRETWFRAHLPFKELFYNKQVLEFQGDHLIIYDPQITREYLQWLQRQNRWSIVFFYGNMVGRARHIYPKQIPEGIAAWTYDSHDSEKYGLHLNQQMHYCRAFCKEKEMLEYDVLFVGKDKGRAEFLFDLEERLNKAGLKTFFRVVGDTRFKKKKDKRYGPEMAYDEICRLIARSRAILNVILPDQEGLTIRDFEAICNDVKLITTNSKLRSRDFYMTDRVLVINENVSADEIKRFLEVPMRPYGEEIKSQLSFQMWIKKMIAV